MPWYFIIILLLLADTLLLTVAAIMKSNNDLSLNLLTQDGEISQVLYANRRIANDLPMMAFRDINSKSVVLISLFPSVSNIQCNINNKNFYYENNIFATALGYIPDIQSMFKRMGRVIESHKNKYGERPSLNKIMYSLSQFLTKGLYSLSDNDDDENDDVTRPYSVNIFLASCNEEGVSLYNIENSGNYFDIDFGYAGKLSESVLLKSKQLVFDKEILFYDKIRSVLKELSEYLCDVENSELNLEVLVINNNGTYLKRNFSITDRDFQLV